MGLLDAVKDQFLDVIEYVDKSNKLIVSKYQRESGNNELKQGSKVIVRESQSAVFLKGGKLADILPPGTYSLTTDNFPVLSSLKAFPYLFVSPVIADVYFVSTRQFIDNKWATKNPIMKRDKDFNMVRIRSFGKFAFRITDVPAFMREIFGTKGIVLTYDIVEYLSSMVTEAFSIAVGESEMSVLDLATEYRKLSSELQQRLNAQTAAIGVQFSDILIENISLPDEVEKLIDEQSGIGMAKQDKYRTISLPCYPDQTQRRAIRCCVRCLPIRRKAAQRVLRGGQRLHPERRCDSVLKSCCRPTLRFPSQTGRPCGTRWKRQNGARKPSLHTVLTLPCRTSFPCRRTSALQGNFYWSSL